VSIRTRDILERMFWTFVTASLTNLAAATFIDVSAWKLAVLAGLTALVNAVVAIGRWRLSVLPDPGAAVADAARQKALDDVAALPPAA
jgi:hypothetical protein